MSNQVNTNLIEDAKEMSEVWAGTMHQSIIDNLIATNDLEALQEAVVKAQQDAYDEFNYERYDEDHPDPEAMMVRAEEIRDAMREDGVF